MSLNTNKFKEILDQVYAEVALPEGKGYQRHGQGTPLENQPWVKITENVGDGFLLGQALKKIFELKTKDPETLVLNPDMPSLRKETLKAWRKEILGAISYLVFALMWKEEKVFSSLQESMEKEIIPVFDPSCGVMSQEECREALKSSYDVNDDFS